MPPSASYGRLMPRGAGFCRVFGGAFNVIPENRLLLDTAPAGANLFAPACVHRQAVWPTSTGTRRGQVFHTVSGGFARVRGTRDAWNVPNAPHCRSRSRISISGGSGCADGFLGDVPFTLQWPPMAVREAYRATRPVLPAGAR